MCILLLFCCIALKNGHKIVTSECGDILAVHCSLDATDNCTVRYAESEVTHLQPGHLQLIQTGRSVREIEITMHNGSTLLQQNIITTKSGK